jgi:hypothetical protein
MTGCAIVPSTFSTRLLPMNSPQAVGFRFASEVALKV